jgi:hypothetical protein
LKVEGEEAKLALKAADADSQQHDREELLAILSEKLTSGHAATILRSHQIASGDIIEGQVSEEAAA